MSEQAMSSVAPPPSFSTAARQSSPGRRWLIALMGVALLVFGFGLFTRVSTPAQTYDAAVPVTWFRLSLQLVQETPGYTPPVASRTFAYLGATLYETVQPGMWLHASLAGKVNGLESMPAPAFRATYHWPLAANAALASMMRRLFPTAHPENLAAIDALERQFAQEYGAAVPDRVYSDSIAWGKRVADAVYVWSITDGGHEGYARNILADYAPPRASHAWVSTPPAYGRSLQPRWGDNRPFVLAHGAACPAGPPPLYSEAPDSDFYREAYEVYQLDRTRTQEQYAIALFWADEPGQSATPPGHWISILNQVLAQESVALDVAAEAYARLGMALADSFITCWATKYEYNLLRPITYIQQVIDPTWYPDGVIAGAIVTPPFPEYTSGHSVQSAAAGVVLTHLFGEDYAFADATHVLVGLPSRRFTSFAHAAQEAALSRLYGGIHFRAAVEDGLSQGECVGEQVSTLPLRRW